MERFFRSLKTERVPALGYRNFTDTQHSITEYLVGYYSQTRPHQYNRGLSPNAAGGSIGLATKPWPALLDHYTYENL
jgi:putative transposase